MKRILGAVIALAFAASASALTPYSELRQEYPGIDDAIAAATESDLHGTFNRLSALLQRNAIVSAEAGDGYAGELPENFERNLEATLIDLAEDLGKDQLEALTPEQMIDILAVVRIYGVRRPLELWQGEVPNPTCPEFTVCPGGPEDPCPTCVDDDTAVMNAIQGTVDASRSLYAIVRSSLSVSDQAAYPVSSALDVSNFVATIGTLSLTIRGVESIDD